MKIAMLQYQKGLIAYQPLLDSQRELVQQQDALAQSRGLVSLDLVAIYKALGGGWRTRLCEEQHAAAEVIPRRGSRALVKGRSAPTRSVRASSAIWGEDGPEVVQRSFAHRARAMMWRICDWVANLQFACCGIPAATTRAYRST